MRNQGCRKDAGASSHRRTDPQTGSGKQSVLTGPCSDLRWYASPAFDLYGFPQWWHFRVIFSSSAAPLPHFLTWYRYPMMLVKLLEQLWTKERGLYYNLTYFYMISKWPHHTNRRSGINRPSPAFPIRTTLPCPWPNCCPIYHQVWYSINLVSNQ